MFRSACLAAALSCLIVAPALAQSGNPLQRPATSQPATTQTQLDQATQPARRARAPQTQPEEKKAESAAEKPKRQRSAAQLANDERMRKCGAEWRANKEKITAQGYNWVKFSTECRARLKAAGQ